MLRYLGATVASILLVSGFVANHVSVTRQLVAIDRQIQAAQVPGAGSAHTSFGIELPERLDRALKLDRLFMRYGAFVIPLVCGLFFAIAFGAGGLRAKAA